MTDPIKIKGLKEIQQKMSRLNQYFRDGDPSIMAIIGKTVIEYITKRTSRGLSVNGSKFKRYTAKYAKDKGVGESSVNLAKSGQMLSDIDKQTTGKVARIYVKKTGRGKITSWELAKIHHFGGFGSNQPDRPFFDVNESEQKKLYKIIQDMVNKKVESIVR